MVNWANIAAGMGQGTTGIASSIFGLIRANKERKKYEKHLNDLESENKAWYNANALGDYTQRADAQNLMAQLRSNLDRSTQRSNATAVVTGTTPEMQLAQKEQNNRVISDTFGQLGAMGQQYKDRVTDRYLTRRAELADKRGDMMQQRIEGSENLMYNGLNMLGQSFATSVGQGGGGSSLGG